MIVVTGATGNIGRAIVAALRQQGIAVRAVARSRQRLASVEQLGAEAAVADLNDSKAMEHALRGATAVFTMIPPEVKAPDVRRYQNQIADTVVAAVRANEVPKVVNLSSVGAHLEDRAGPVNGLHDAELRLNRIQATDVLHLRPTFFMENFFMGLQMIRSSGVFGSPLEADLPMPMIATRDIAWFAADRLTFLDFAGKATRELLGPRDYTMREATAVLGAAIGRPELRYVQVPYEAAERGMVEQGVSADMARQYVELYRAMNEGVFRAVEHRGPDNTTETTLEAFAAEVFAPAYEAGAR